MSKRIISFFLIFSSLVMLSACRDKRGYLELGLEIPDTYREKNTEDTFDAAYSDGVAVIGIIRLSFQAAIDDGIVETYSPEGFAKYYKNRIEKSECEIKFSGDAPYIVYEEGEEIPYSYLTSFYRTRYAYFVVTFVTESVVFSDYEAEFIEIAGSAYLDYE